MKAEGPSGSSANSPREGKVKEIVFDESFTDSLAPSLTMLCSNGPLSHNRPFLLEIAVLILLLAGAFV